VKTRTCPVTPDVCLPVIGWEPFCVHVYEAHTDPALSETERTAEVDRILHLSPAERAARQQALRASRSWTPPAAVVPKVTAFAETAAVWELLRGDLSRAREIVTAMNEPERTGFELRLTELLNILGGLR